MTDIHLNPGGPHSPQYTRQVAAALAEAVRVLNHATFPPAGEALAYPSDMDAVVQELATAVMRFPQLFSQLARWLGEQEDAGKLEINHGPCEGRPWRAVATFKALMTDAEGEADRLHRALDRARQVTATIGAPYDPSEDPDA
jgi:hypothetical protein